MSETWVYLVSEGEWGPVKVGISQNVAARFASIQVGNPRQLRVAEQWRFATREEAVAVEREVLEEMSAYAVRGEWIKADEFGMCGLISRRIRERAAR